MFSKIKHKFKKLGFISIELVILASVMLTAGGYGVAKLGSNMSGASKNQDGMFGEAMKELKGDVPEYVTNIRDGKINTLYDVGEANLTDSDIVEINGIPCYVLEIDETNNRAKLITKDIYNVRFDDVNYNKGNKTNVGKSGNYVNLTYDYSQSYLRKWMNDFYNNELSKDDRIVKDPKANYYTCDSFINLNLFKKETITTDPVFALDAVEARAKANKFNWSYTNQMGGRGTGFWTSAGFLCGDLSIAFRVSYNGVFTNNNVGNTSDGARPVFWISLADKVN